MGIGEALIRVLIATAVGALLGINRERLDKPAGVKTLALVGLGSAFAPVIILESTASGPDAMSRVVQGVLTGVGFLGAGVIMKGENVGDVQGLTTAALVWVVAGLGLAAGMGMKIHALIGAAVALTVLTVGYWLERAVQMDDNSTPRPPV